jgi:hypothetical protein
MHAELEQAVLVQRIGRVLTRRLARGQEFRHVVEETLYPAMEDYRIDLVLNEVYNEKILDLAGNIPRLGRLPGPDASATAHSKLCGSTVTVDVKMDGPVVTDFAHDVKACALGQASSSIMARHVIGANPRAGLVSGLYMLVFEKHVVFCGDTTVNIEPTLLTQTSTPAARAASPSPRVRRVARTACVGCARPATGATRTSSESRTHSQAQKRATRARLRNGSESPAHTCVQ